MLGEHQTKLRKLLFVWKSTVTSFIYAHIISIKFNSQWNFGKNIIECPYFSAISWSQILDADSLKSSHAPNIPRPQQLTLSVLGPSLVAYLHISHSKSNLWLGYKPLSSRIVFTPFCLPAAVCINCGTPFQTVFRSILTV